MDHSCSRRAFLKQTGLAAGALPLVSVPECSASPSEELPDIYIFSKHLQFLNHTDMAEAAASMGFAGVDVTVRPDGHVQPERVEEELPSLVEALKKVGFSPALMTTAVGDATNVLDRNVLTTAAKLGFRMYRMNWYQYGSQQSIPAAIQDFQQQVRTLGELNKSLNISGCYQNHAGLLVGASAWELWELLKTADPAYMGVQYDIRHATVEGGQSWPTGLRLLQPRIKSITIKDFRWAKNPSRGNKWIVQDAPLGEGMVDFSTYFNTLKNSHVRIPISLHMEYPMGGAEHGATKLSIPHSEVFTAIKRDFNRLKELWNAA